MNFIITWNNGALKVQADGLVENVALAWILALVVVALAGIGAWIYTRRSR